MIRTSFKSVRKLAGTAAFIAVLISVVLDFRLDATDPGNEIGYVGLLPGYAATGDNHVLVFGHASDREVGLDSTAFV